MNEKIEIRGNDIEGASPVVTYGGNIAISVRVKDGELVRLDVPTLIKLLQSHNFVATKSRTYYYIDEISG